MNNPQAQNSQTQNSQPQQAFWQLDKAKAAKVGQSSYISANTAEIYQIISAAWKSRSNSVTRVDSYFMSLHIINADKSTAHIDVYYGNSDGDRWSGENIINAVMLCANVPSLTQGQGQYAEYNHNERKDVQVGGLVAPELAGKKVGLFLADNHYFNENQGEVKRGGLNLFNVFDAQTRQLPHEKSAATPANPDSFIAVMEAMVKFSQKSLDDANKKAGVSSVPQNQFSNQAASQPAQNNSVNYQRGTPAQQQNPAMTGGGAVDDDIPFAAYFDGQM